MSATIILNIPTAKERRILTETTIQLDKKIYQETIINRAYENINRWFEEEINDSLTSATIFISTVADHPCLYHKECIPTISSIIKQKLEELGYSVKINYDSNNGKLEIFIQW